MDEERAALAEERMLVEWARMHSDNKENIPTFEDIVSGMSSTPNSVQPVSLASSRPETIHLLSIILFDLRNRNVPCNSQSLSLRTVTGIKKLTFYEYMQCV